MALADSAVPSHGAVRRGQMGMEERYRSLRRCAAGCLGKGLEADLAARHCGNRLRLSAELSLNSTLDVAEGNFPLTV